MTARREQARARGPAAEWFAAFWLRLKGYRILARQFRANGGELDVVALTPRWKSPCTIVFVEVRTRGTLAQAVASVGATKRGRVERAARQFCARSPALGRLPRRFDLVVLAQTGWPRHIPDAWRS
ncbi:MAG: YraN family protein [Alphaproteobacteria bacterium]